MVIMSGLAQLKMPLCVSVCVLKNKTNTKDQGQLFFNILYW